MCLNGVNKVGTPNIVVKWNPQVNLKLYLLQKAANSRASQIRQDAGEDASEEFLDAMKDIYFRNNEAYEMYDAVLTTIGIPCDIPLCLEITIKPRILETISRTSGVYMLQECTDRISSNGLFTSEYKLLRVRAIGESPVNKAKADTKSTGKDTVDLSVEPDKTNESTDNNNNNRIPTQEWEDVWEKFEDSRVPKIDLDRAHG